jgi:glucose-1-phosphate cytidylyltransferase
MKVVLFCGGLGLRLRGYADDVPKPMVPIGDRPILWHLMKYYAHFGFKDFILCLGHRGSAVKRFFIDYDAWLSTDFVLEGKRGGTAVVESDISDWRITFVDTGLHANIAERLVKIRPYLGDDELFLCNYSDNLTDAPLPDQIRFLQERPELVASFMSTIPALSMHAVTTGSDGYVESIVPITQTGLRVNGGFFVFRQAFYDYIRPGEDLMDEPFARLLRERRVVAHVYDGFWQAMDTLKDWKVLDDLHNAEKAPWELWKRPSGAPV